jgi:hypothetical protein
MISVVMRDQNASNRFARKRPFEHWWPLHRITVCLYATIDQYPAISSIQRIEIDVIQPEWQAETKPIKIVSKRNHLSGRGHIDIKRLHSGMLSGHDLSCA